MGPQTESAPLPGTPAHLGGAHDAGDEDGEVKAKYRADQYHDGPALHIGDVSVHV